MKLKRILLFPGVNHNIKRPKPGSISKIINPKKSKPIKRNFVEKKVNVKLNAFCNLVKHKLNAVESRRKYKEVVVEKCEPNKILTKKCNVICERFNNFDDTCAKKKIINPVVKLIDIALIEDSSKYFPFVPVSKNILSDITNSISSMEDSFTNTVVSCCSNQTNITREMKIVIQKCDNNIPVNMDVGDQQKYQENINPLKYQNLKIRDIVGYCGTDYIVLIQSTDSKYKRDKILSVVRHTEKETRNSCALKKSWKAFIYIRNENIVGCLIAEPNITAYRVLKPDSVEFSFKNSCLVKCGINRIWVQSDYRRQNIATELMNNLRKNFVPKEYLQIDHIAFLITTSDGYEFVKKYTGRDNYLSYSNTV